MKREICLLLFVFLASGVFAIEGVSPGSYNVDFESGLEKEFVFDFVLDGKEEVLVNGDLAEYVTLDKDEVLGREKVVAKLKLPQLDSFHHQTGQVLKFGVNNIWIVAGDVRGLIKVKVPYPDNFVKLDINIPNANVGEDVNAVLKVSNFDKEDMSVSPIVDVYSNGEVVESYNLTSEMVGAGMDFDFDFILSDFVKNLPGDYLAVARVDCGESVSEAEDVFRIGEFKIRILDYTRGIDKGVEKFEIEIESLWNGKMEEVFAEVRVVGTDEGFDTSIVSLGAWERNALVGFFDTRGLKEDVDVDIRVHYDGAVISDVVSVKVASDPNWWLWGSVGVVVLLCLLFFLWRAIFVNKK